MNAQSDREKEAILRMMVYIKHELLRNSCEIEAKLVAKAIDTFQHRLGKEME